MPPNRCDNEVLIQVEPTRNLDAATGRVVWELRLALNREQGATLVLVTHEQSLAECAGRAFCCAMGG
jgi:putative ABC transport system ATP-binding protein